MYCYLFFYKRRKIKLDIMVLFDDEIHPFHVKKMKLLPISHNVFKMNALSFIAPPADLRAEIQALFPKIPKEIFYRF